MNPKDLVTLSPSPSTSTESSQERKVIKLTKRMNIYVFTENDSNLLIKGSISSLTINGHNNKIVIRSSVPTLIINGHGNLIKSTYYKNSLCDIIFNNNNNKIKIAKGSSFINKIDNGKNNKIYSAIKEKNKIASQTNNNETENDKNETDNDMNINNSNFNINISFSININEIVSLFSNQKRKREEEYY